MDETKPKFYTKYNQHSRSMDPSFSCGCVEYQAKTTFGKCSDYILLVGWAQIVRVR